MPLSNYSHFEYFKLWTDHKNNGAEPVSAVDYNHSNPNGREHFTSEQKVLHSLPPFFSYIIFFSSSVLCFLLFSRLRGAGERISNTSNVGQRADGTHEVFSKNVWVCSWKRVGRMFLILQDCCVVPLQVVIAVEHFISMCNNSYNPRRPLMSSLFHYQIDSPLRRIPFHLLEHFISQYMHCSYNTHNLWRPLYDEQ